MRKLLLVVSVMLAAPAYAQSTNTVGDGARSWVQQGDGARVQAATTSAANNSGVNVDASSRDRTVYAPGLPGMASGPCTGAGGGASAGWFGFGGGASITTMDDRCTARETARMLDMVGLRSHAQAVMLREYAKVMGTPEPTPPRFNEGN
jgi:hypothetical protein